jgi:arylsulfatase A-like enzyme
MFEGGLRVPAIISWPGRIPQGEVRPQIAHGCDWLPTLADLCGVKLQQSDIDGKSLIEVLADANAPSPHDVIHWQVGEGGGAQWAVRQGEWKLIGNPRIEGEKFGPDDRLFLTNTAQDPSEAANLAGQYPQVVERLKKQHEAWSSSLGQ